MSLVWEEYGDVLLSAVRSYQANFVRVTRSEQRDFSQIGRFDENLGFLICG